MPSSNPSRFPYLISSTLVSVFNWWQYRVRRAGVYAKYYEYYKSNKNGSREYLLKEQERRLNLFLEHARKNSPYYSERIEDKWYTVSNLKELPLLTKEDVMNDLVNIATVSEKNGFYSETGGSTGASLKVIHSGSDIQEKQAFLDVFRNDFGFSPGNRTAWFSGKDLVTEADINKGIVYRDDWFCSIRFFSTFHIRKSTAKIYWEGLKKFDPEYIVGFPSSFYEIAMYAKSLGLSHEWRIKAFFPTAEVLTQQHRDLIKEVFGCDLYDQYASSEGAPFITECSQGTLHANILTGVFEVLGDSESDGELCVTSFCTTGTPLVRYRIGDSVSMAEPGERCTCGSEMPIVKKIMGRKDDFLYNDQGEKINLGNISNCTKSVLGVIKFQVVQNEIGEIIVNLIPDQNFNSVQLKKFLDNLHMRFGAETNIQLNKVSDIPLTKSGKFRFILNNVSVR